MDSRGALKLGLMSSQNIVEGYLGDLSDADLLVRPVPGSNHIAWQMGHLLNAERWMIDLVCPGSMPELPASFRDGYSNDTASSDDPSKFLTKAEYLEQFHAVRKATLAALEKVTDEQLDQPAPAKLQHFLPTVGHVFSMQGTHWMMHAGQWSVIRRKLGKPPLF